MDSPTAKKFPKRGRLAHVDHIPGGKRFWKVGHLYQLTEFVMLYSQKTDLVEVKQKTHRRNNSRWLNNNVYNPFIPGQEPRHRIEKGSIFMLLAKPDYKTVIGNTNGDTLAGSYQLNILCNEKSGWIHLSHRLSPRYYCSPLK